MKVHLMFRNKDFEEQKQCFCKDTLETDLALTCMLSAMSQKDDVVHTTCSSALFSPLQPLEEIHYRQENLRDALQNPDVIRQLYDITVKTEQKKRNSLQWLFHSAYLSSTFSSAVNLLQLYTKVLMELRQIADINLSYFHSEGFHNLFTMFQQELNDEYFIEVQSHLDALKEDNESILISASLGNYMQGVNYVLRRKIPKRFWWRWHVAPSYTIAPRDDSGATDLSMRRGRAINEATNALAQATEHIECFFAMLRRELAFYIGCLNLADKLHELGMPTCIPDLQSMESTDRSWQGLYDISLALTKDKAVVENNLDAKDKQLYIITGANQGGKSTFLRSVGQSQLMAQCGMFVGAGSSSLPLRKGVFSHFKKEEDTTMKSGKLDEELARMSEQADYLQKGDLMLFNESFASTNEREGSEICRQITQALIENDIEVFFVTHLYTYAVAFMENTKTQYLRAQRLEAGKRTFEIVPGKPLDTAFGEDLYHKIFSIPQDDTTGNRLA
jgi:DNA mismatch repair ATPase MutS